MKSRNFSSKYRLKRGKATASRLDGGRGLDAQVYKSVARMLVRKRSGGFIACSLWDLARDVVRARSYTISH
jgi:hypothetical protein